MPFNAVMESAIYEFGVYFCLIKVLYGEEQVLWNEYGEPASVLEERINDLIIWNSVDLPLVQSRETGRLYAAIDGGFIQCSSLL